MWLVNLVGKRKPMGFEPLPFDPRNACFCRQGCKSFRQPTSRWWTVWSDPPPSIPELGTGVLVEFDLALPAIGFCQFSAVVKPVGVLVYRLTMFPVQPIGSNEIRRNVQASTNVGTGIARNFLVNEECNIPLNIAGFPPADIFGGCNIFPVRWFENANDVPH